MPTLALVIGGVGLAAYVGLILAVQHGLRDGPRLALMGLSTTALVWLLEGTVLALILLGVAALLTVGTCQFSRGRYAAPWIVLIVVILIGTKLPFWSAGSGNVSAGFGLSAWLGFSYLAFRLIHVTVEGKNGKLPDNLSLTELLTYALHPASLVAGPIDRVKNSVKAQREPAPLTESLHSGTWRILRGVVLKYVIANPLYIVVSTHDMAADPDRPVAIAWLWLASYSFYLLADFAAYSDIAIGAGRLAGIDLPENFNQPYRASSLTVFWQRWHISLSSWLRDLIFFPVARALRKRYKTKYKAAIQFTAHMLTMIATGLWHGLSSGFLAWGVWHGLGMFITSQLGWGKPRKSDAMWAARVRSLSSHAGTYLFVTLGWVFFTTDFVTALHIFGRLFGIR